MRRLPDDPGKRRVQQIKRLYQHLEHFKALVESGQMSMPPIVTIPETGEEIYLNDLMVGIDSLPPQQRRAFDLICLSGYTETDATKIILPGSRWSTPCLVGSTEFVTIDGVRTLQEAVTTRQKVLGINGWVEASIEYFGPQKVYELQVRRDNESRFLLTTAEHRWFSTDLKEVVTTSLCSGDHLCTVSGPEWVLSSIRNTDRLEDVFCAVVPDGEAFVLAGDILTGNCQQYADSALDRMIRAYDTYQETGDKPASYIDRRKKNGKASDSTGEKILEVRQQDE